MRIVYTCYGGAHSSPVAAAIHLNLLTRHRLPTAHELLSLPLYEKTTRRQHGSVIFVGCDHAGHAVYVLGRGAAGPAVVRAVKSGMALAGQSGGEVFFVNTLAAVNTWMRIGGFLSRGLGFTFLGRPLVIYGTQRAFPQLVRLVEDVERRLQNGTMTCDFADV